MTEHRGRLELTWTNKDLALLAHEDGSYEWVDPADHRIREIRLLRDAGAVGEVHPDTERTKDNLLIRGDALCALEALTSLPEFAEEFVGKVKLIYIDPPFNTGQAFQHYDDALEHSVWLTMMRDRLEQAKKLLSPDGSIWVHLDDVEAAHCRMVLDEVFGRDNFVATFIWQKVDSPSENREAIATDHDYIHCYSARPGGHDFTQRPDPSVLKAYRVAEDGTLYRDRLLRKNGKDSLRSDRPKMWFPITDPDGGEAWPIDDQGVERRWALGRETVERLQAEGEILWRKRPNAAGEERWVPYVREYPKENPTKPWPTIWTDVLTTRQSKAHLRKLFPGVPVFSTPKPEPLMKRILEIATKPGDLVLDFFAGSGTTAAVAHKLGRRWIAVERERDTIDTFMAPRLKMVVEGEDPGGITEEAGWEGGGGFRVLDVAPSMYEEDAGVIVLAEWATNGKLSEATAAQLGFEHEPDPPFCGRRRRIRLAVIDGHADEVLVRELVRSLADGEKLSLCATSLDPKAAELLAKLRPGSQARVIPEDILLSYRTPSAWRVSVAKPPSEVAGPAAGVSEEASAEDEKVAETAATAEAVE